MSLIYNATFDKNTRKLSFEDRAGNEIYSFTVPERVPVDSVTKPLTFKATQDGSTVSLKQNGSPNGAFQVSWNGGKNWENYTIGTAISLNTGDKVSFRAKADRTTDQNFYNYFYFIMEGKIEAWHNVMSMINAYDFTVQEISIAFAFNRMFKGCTSLVKAPTLPATTLADQCYRDMFNGCTSLIKAPELPATTLANYCYAGMFNGCTSLVNASVLPVTTLAEYCYFWMFSNCTSLVKAPELPATTLAANCYTSMFYGCSSLNEVHCQMPSTISEEDIPTYTGDGSDSSMSPWLEGVSPTGTFYTNGDANWPSGSSGIPIGWTRDPAWYGITKPLTFRATQNGSTVKLTKTGSPTGSFQTSRDGGNTWSDYTLDSAITLNIGDEVSFRAKENRTSSQSLQNYFKFKMTGKIEAWYNVMSMLRTNDFATYDTTVSYAFYHLFDGCTSLVKAPALPATTLAESCYRSMFAGCTSLTKAPALPVTTLANDCYNCMFYGCTSLVKAPALPATTLAPNCYHSMFERCASLTKAPELPVTELAEGCYRNMFYGCTSLTKAPSLPATTLAPYCYEYMFYGCTSLTEAPELPATTLDRYCYSNMFSNCTSLAKAPELRATTLAKSCYTRMFYGCSSLNKVRCKMPSSYSSSDISSYANNWLGGVSSTGTFYTNADANWPSGASGIPTGWRRVNTGGPAVDDITKPLTFRATQDASRVILNAKGSPDGTFQTSMDGGNTWEDYTIGTAIALDTDDEVSFRAKSDRTSTQSSKNHFYFTMGGKIEAWHNVMSLYRTNDFATYDTTIRSAFYHLFDACGSLIKAPVLPATTLGERCYSNMFLDCTSLTKAPSLPATTLAPYCYQNMFKGCTSLTKSPALPATTLATSCYSGMFNGCRILNEVRCQMPSSISAEDIPTYTGSGTYDAWLSNVSSTGTFYTNSDANWPSGASGIPEGWTRVNEEVPTVDDIRKPLTFRATQNGSTVTLKQNGSPTGDFQTSSDGGSTWTDYTIGTAVTLNTGGKVSFRAKADRTTDQSSGDYFSFQMTGKIEAWHNVMSLYRTSDFATYESVINFAFSRLFYGCESLTKAPVLPSTTLAPRCYQEMFAGCTSLVESPELPATTLADFCYTIMFGNCTSLTKAPELPATTLADYCYNSMFRSCTSLTEAPELPATTLAPRCYFGMFEYCTSLTKAPELPVTTLAQSCYTEMFRSCTSLTEAPVLPATTLAQSCYTGMFNGCTSLTKAPALPATTLANYCYRNMFKGCTSLTKAPELHATTLASNCYTEMFNGCSSLNEVRCKMPSSYSSSSIGSTYAYNWLLSVSSTGTFYTNADANWPSGSSGIPTGWNRVNEGTPAVDNIRKPLTFKATQDGSTVKLRNNGSPTGSFQTSRDGGNTWTDYTIGTVITLNNGDEVSFRTSADRTSGQTVQNYFYFEMTGKIEAWHNVMSLYRTNDFATYSHIVSYAFNSMFNRCTSLTKAPKLPVTTLAHGCYRKMFEGCTSLTKPPALPATTLAVACYYGMFDGCTSLTKAPELPVTTLDSACYQYMFYGCTSLTKTPALSATTLAEDCYQEMFRNCSSLNEVRCKIPSSYSSSAIPSYATYWLSGVSSKGTFYTNADANWPSGDDGIPQTWTRANIDDYPTT